MDCGVIANRRDNWADEKLGLSVSTKLNTSNCNGVNSKGKGFNLFMPFFAIQAGIK